MIPPYVAPAAGAALPRGAGAPEAGAAGRAGFLQLTCMAPMSTPKRRPADRTGCANEEAPPTRKLRRKTDPSSSVADYAETEVTVLRRATAAFRPGGFQGKLPCREVEQGEIVAHLRTAIRQGGSMQILYVSGMPGTGKTASVLRAVEHLKCTHDVAAFACVHVNAMRLGTPAAVFGEIHSQLPRGVATRCPAGAAHGELTSFFAQRGADDPVVLLLVDEIDHLVTRNQAVLYRIFDWLSLPKPRLVVVAISNTMDLPERLLPRVASRFGIVRVDFAPYGKEQIVRILRERLEAHMAAEAFAPVALKLCAARVAAGSGDIRKALQLCSRAVEVRLAAAHISGPANVAHLEVAERDLLRASPATRAIGFLGLGARRLLLAVLLELRRQEAEAVPLRSVATRYAKLVTAMELPSAADEVSAGKLPAPMGLQGPAEEESAFLADRLEAMALLVLQAHSVGFGRTIALGAGLDTEDLAGVLEQVEDDCNIQELIRSSARR